MRLTVIQLIIHHAKHASLFQHLCHHDHLHPHLHPLHSHPSHMSLLELGVDDFIIGPSSSWQRVPPAGRNYPPTQLAWPLTGPTSTCSCPRCPSGAASSGLASRRSSGLWERCDTFGESKGMNSGQSLSPHSRWMSRRSLITWAFSSSSPSPPSSSPPYHL